MLIQELVKYTQTYLAKELEEGAFEEKPVPYLILVSEEGKFLGVRSRFSETQKKDKTVFRPRTLSIAKSPVARNAGLHPLPTCDSVQYVLGPHGSWTDKGKEKNHEERFDSFKELIKSLAASEDRIPNEERNLLKSAVAFYERPEELEAARAELALLKPVAGSNVALAVPDPKNLSDDRILISLRGLRGSWRDHYESKMGKRAGQEQMCLATGEFGPVLPTHDPVSGSASLGGQPSGFSLISFDKASSESYGWTQNHNAGLGVSAAKAYVMALSHLLIPGQHRQGKDGNLVPTRFSFDSGMAWLYWTSSPGSDDPLESILSPTSERIERLFSSPFKGEAQKPLEVNNFCFLSISANGGRIIVRDWKREDLRKIEQNIRNWFSDIRIGSHERIPFLFQILDRMRPELSSSKSKSSDPKRERLMQALLTRALFGRPLGYEILSSALSRLRVENNDHDNKNKKSDSLRMGLIRMVLNDLLKVEKDRRKFVSEGLDEKREDVGYLCGRLLSIYSSIQFFANQAGNTNGSKSSLNKDVVDLFYAAASTQPRSIFPRIVSLGQKHLSSLRTKAPWHYGVFSREIASIMASVKDFPAVFDLKNQGFFALGFYHQEDHRMKIIKERLESKEKAE